MNTQTQLTNEEILEKLEGSALEATEKMTLKPLIEHMSDEEKEEFLGIIDESNQLNQERDEFKKNYKEGLKELNEEYTHKMDELSKKSSSEARKKFEELEDQKENQELKDLEKEINEV